MKHYGSFLPFAGRQVKDRAFLIENLMLKKERLTEELRLLEDMIEDEESEFSEFIDDDWDQEEMQAAIDRANEYNNRKRI